MSVRDLEKDIEDLAERLASPFVIILDKLNEAIDHVNFQKEKIRRLEKRVAELGQNRE